jgi:hypothetical protein
MHCVNKLKRLPQFWCQQVEIIKKLNKVQIIFISKQSSDCNNYEQYWVLISATSHL